LAFASAVKWTNPVRLDDTCLRQLLPDLHKTSYAEGIRITIESMRADMARVKA
jgi:hypothetical protein